MGKINKNQSGFGTVEGILILIIVVLLGAVGWFVYDRNKNTPTSTATVPATSTPTVATTTTTDTTKYLVIKEWGVEIPLTTDIADAYYTTLKDDTNGASDYAIGIRSLTALDASCSAEEGSVSLIFRQTISEYNANSKKNDPLNYPVYTTKIGSYYYGYDRSRAACSNNQKANNLQTATFNSLEKAFKGLKAVN